jgi:hypothetical protein
MNPHFETSHRLDARLVQFHAPDDGHGASVAAVAQQFLQITDA